MSLVGKLYKAARTVNTASAIANPKRAPRRARNIVVGRALARAGVWNRLWKGKL